MLRRVALIYDATRAYDLKVVAGVATYLQKDAGWSIYIEETALKDQRLPDLRSWKGDGIIANFDDRRVAKAVMQSRLPAVAFGSGYGWYGPKSNIPYFFTNNQAIARIAADHFLDRGFWHFAYCGYPRTPINGWSEERELAFRKQLRDRKFECHVYRARPPADGGWAPAQHALRVWLESLPKPLALMAANDNRGRQVLEACRSSGLRVPEEVAVIGVDNDELLCQLSTPLMSSIEQGARRIGYEAAGLLDRIMSRQRSRYRRFVIDPLGVVTRRSTDIFAVQDPLIERAMAFVRDRVSHGIKAQDVVKAVAVSRSGLELRFKAALGRTLHGAIRHVQLDRARGLITDTNLPLKEVAANSGFKSVQHMTTLFRKAFGHAPGQYRNMASGTAGSDVPAQSVSSNRTREGCAAETFVRPSHYIPLIGLPAAVLNAGRTKADCIKDLRISIKR